MAITPQKLIEWKKQGKKIVALTAWDYAIAKIIDRAGIDLILVGDSLGMVSLGYPTTIPVTLEEMLHHAKAVRRGVELALLVCDLPFLSYHENLAQAIQSAGRVIKETGVQAVKLEGGHPAIASKVSALVQLGIPVLGHVGLTPQSVHQLGWRKQGTTEAARDNIFNQAIALEEAGAFAIVLEHIPYDLAQNITEILSIPTIGIGAGPDCDGQILVTADLIGLTPKQPPFAKVYSNLFSIITETVSDYIYTKD